MPSNNTNHLYTVDARPVDDDSELFSYNERSYNSWQYGDEASLYSIAEDSREDRASEIMTAENASSSAAPATTVELQWAQAAENEPQDSSSRSSSFDDCYYGYQQQSAQRKRILGFCIGGLLLIAVASAVAISVGNNRTDQVPRSNVGEGVVDTNDDSTSNNNPSPPITPPVTPPVSPPSTVTTTTTSPTASPTTAEPQTATTLAPTPAPSTPSPTSSPTHSNEYKLADGLVFSALSQCAGNLNDLQDPSTLQGQVYQSLVLELLDQVFVSSDGFVNYPLQYGMDYLQEKYALGMLYAATNGNAWLDNTGWTQPEQDPCDGWMGIVNCKTRREGSCGVVHINLNANQLDGVLPAALCCLPCLETLSLAQNQLQGTIPQCLIDNSAVTMDLEENQFASPQTTADIASWP